MNNDEIKNKNETEKGKRHSKNYNYLDRKDLKKSNITPRFLFFSDTTSAKNKDNNEKINKDTNDKNINKNNNEEKEKNKTVNINQNNDNTQNNIISNKNKNVKDIDKGVTVGCC